MKGNDKLHSRLPRWFRQSFRATAVIVILLGITFRAAVLIGQDVDDDEEEPFDLQKTCPPKPDPIKFLAAHGGVFSNVELKTFPDGIRGLSVKRQVHTGGILAQIPKKLTFTYATASGMSPDSTEEERKLQKLWLAHPEMPELDRLTLTLLYLTSLPTSRWDWYLCTIPPPKEMGPPLMWSEKRLRKYCTEGKYKTLCYWVDVRHAYYRKVYKEEFQGIAKNFPDLFPGTTLSYRNYIWAATAVNSRFWNMCDSCQPRFHRNGTILSEPKYLMGGGVDLFNHKRNSGHIQWGKGRDSNMFQVVSSEGVEAGEQAHISYGDKCNLSLLLEYGFTIPNNPEKCAGDDDYPSQTPKPAALTAKPKGPITVTVVDAPGDTTSGRDFSDSDSSDRNGGASSERNVRPGPKHHGSNGVKDGRMGPPRLDPDQSPMTVLTRHEKHVEVGHAVQGHVAVHIDHPDRAVASDDEGDDGDEEESLEEDSNDQAREKREGGGEEEGGEEGVGSDARREERDVGNDGGRSSDARGEGRERGEEKEDGGRGRRQREEEAQEEGGGRALGGEAGRRRWERSPGSAGSDGE